MNLEELKHKVDRTYELCRNPKEVEVCITLDMPSMGSRAKCKVINASKGIDWERNEFRVTPEVALIKKSNQPHSSVD